MKKIILIITILIITGCTKPYKGEKIYLENKYYGKNDFIKVNNLDKEKHENYILFTYNSYCNMAKPCEDTFKEFMQKYNIAFLSIPYEKFKKTNIYKTVKYAPSVIIISKGNTIAYLDAEKDEDLDKYQELEKFEKWIKKYIHTKKWKQVSIKNLFVLF